ncbi:MAG: hypothetical protein ABIA04_05065 [Pseudomonadota bacterium]
MRRSIYIISILVISLIIASNAFSKSNSKPKKKEVRLSDNIPYESSLLTGDINQDIEIHLADLCSSDLQNRKHALLGISALIGLDPDEEALAKLIIPLIDRLEDEDLQVRKDAAYYLIYLSISNHGNSIPDEVITQLFERVNTDNLDDSNFSYLTLCALLDSNITDDLKQIILEDIEAIKTEKRLLSSRPGISEEEAFAYIVRLGSHDHSTLLETSAQLVLVSGSYYPLELKKTLLRTLLTQDPEIISEDYQILSNINDIYFNLLKSEIPGEDKELIVSPVLNNILHKDYYKSLHATYLVEEIQASKEIPFELKKRIYDTLISWLFGEESIKRDKAFDTFFRMLFTFTPLLSETVNYLAPIFLDGFSHKHPDTVYLCILGIKTMIWLDQLDIEHKAAAIPLLFDFILHKKFDKTIPTAHPYSIIFQDAEEAITRIFEADVSIEFIEELLRPYIESAYETVDPNLLAVLDTTVVALAESEMSFELKEKLILAFVKDCALRKKDKRNSSVFTLAHLAETTLPGKIKEHIVEPMINSISDTAGFLESPPAVGIMHLANSDISTEFKEKLVDPIFKQISKTQYDNYVRKKRMIQAAGFLIVSDINTELKLKFIDPLIRSIGEEIHPLYTDWHLCGEYLDRCPNCNHLAIEALAQYPASNVSEETLAYIVRQVIKGLSSASLLRVYRTVEALQVFSRNDFPVYLKEEMVDPLINTRSRNLHPDINESIDWALKFLFETDISKEYKDKIEKLS